MTRVTLKHGLSRTPEYRVWQQMRLRCTDPKHRAWKDYGGRGITVCAQWLSSPQQFMADLGAKPSPAHELDRIDNARGYEPGNCRWALRTVNCRNRRSNRLIEHEGESLALVAWAERAAIDPGVLARRLNSGWGIAVALATPIRPKAVAGQAKKLLRRACAECGGSTGATLCKPCANRRNGAKHSIGNAVAPQQACDLIAALRAAA